MNLDSMLGDMSNLQMPTTPEEVFAMVSSLGATVIIPIIALLFVEATWSWRLLKLMLPVSGAIIFAALGNLLVPFAVETVGNQYIGPISVGSAVVLLCALAGALLMGLLYKLAIILLGAAGGWAIGGVISGMIAANQPDLELFVSTDGNPSMGSIIVCAVCAILLGVLAVFVFKALYIIISSVGSMIIAFTLAGVTLVNPTDETSMTLLAVFMILGIVVGVFCAVHQFKTAND